MSQLAELKKQFLLEMGRQLHPLGFSPKPVGQSFRMAKPFGWASIHLSFVTHPTIDFDVVVNAAVRIEAVQVLIQDIDDPLITDADRKSAATLGCELGNLKGIGQKRWTVSSERDVRPVASAILRECHAELLPFIEQFSRLENVLMALNGGGEFAELISPIEAKRIKTIDAISGLLGKGGGAS
jgi:hypothetical protein